MKRKVWWVFWKSGAWCVKLPDGTTLQYESKEYAVAYARVLAMQAHYQGANTQLKVKGKSGRIQFERTYGNDPKRFPG